MPSSNIKRKKRPGTHNAANGSASHFTETAMDEFLANLNLYRKPIAKDGSCLFRAVSEQVYNCQAKHLQVRKDCIDFMRRNREKFEAFLEGPFDHHLFRLQNPKEWAGQVEISALSLMYKKDFVVYQEINTEPTKVTDNNFEDKILLCYSNNNHYDAVYNLQFQKDAALCQSLVYEVLYQKVFSELDRRENLARFPKAKPPADLNNVMSIYQNGLVADDSFKEDSEDNSGWTEVRYSKAKSARQNRGQELEDFKDEAVTPSLDQKHGWQVKRSLDSEMYRNVELEVWEDSKNGQEQQDRSYAASIQYQPGDKCFAFVGQPDVADKVYEANVIRYPSFKGNIEVRIPELQNKSFVIPLENLKPTDNQQELNYRDLSGYYKKSEGADGLRDDAKRGGKRRNLPPRPPRGARGDEQADDTPIRKGFQDDSFGRPRSGAGPRDKFGRGRGRGRYPRVRDERQQQRGDVEARQLAAERAKLAELQEKDPAAFPALPTQQVDERPPPSTEAAPDQTPAEFWSRLKSAQGKQATVTPRELNHASVATDNKPTTVPTTVVNHQSNSAKVDEKELETRKEKPPAKELKGPVSVNSEAVSREGDVAKKVEVEASETNSSSAALESSKLGQNEVGKTAFPVEKDQVKDNTELSKGAVLNETKQPTTVSSPEWNATVQQTYFEPLIFGDVSEASPVWSKESPGRKETKTQENNVKGLEEEELKKTEEPISLKQGVRGVLRMNNLNSKPQTTLETEEPAVKDKEDVKLLRKEDNPNVKSVLIGETSPSSSPEKKTVTFAEPLKEGEEIKLHLNTGKDFATGKDGKKEILAPPTLVSVVMKPAPASENAQGDNPTISILAANKNTPEDEAPAAKSPISSNNTTSTPHEPDSYPEDTTQTTGASQPAPSTSPTVSQHQASYQLLPEVHAMYMQLPNMTSRPRMPQGISIESDGSDLPDDPNTLRYFFNLGLQYHLNQQWATQQQMMYFSPVYPMPSQEHMQPHPAVSIGQQLSPAVPQMMYQAQPMQAYHPAQVTPAMQENANFSERNSMDGNSPGQTQTQQQPQQQGMPLHQGPAFMNHHHPPWRAARAATSYPCKPMHMGGYNSQMQNQQTPRGPMQQGTGGNNPRHKTKRYPKTRGDQYYNAQSQHAQNQGHVTHGAHAFSSASQTAASPANSFHMASSDHTAGKGTGDYFHGNQQFANFQGGASSQAQHSAGANVRAPYL